jgi:hypothetical protein
MQSSAAPVVRTSSIAASSKVNVAAKSSKASSIAASKASSSLTANSSKISSVASSKANSSLASTSKASSSVASSNNKASSSSKASSAASSNKTSSSVASSSKASSSKAGSSIASSSKASSSKPSNLDGLKGALGATIQWSHPTARENGTYLTIDEIGGYEIRYKALRDTLYTHVSIPGNGVTKYQFPLSIIGLQFEIAVYDKQGLYSEFVPIQSN